MDLSVVINEQTPVYLGDPATQIKPVGHLEKDGYNDHFISMGTHVGTHIDAPFHMLGNGKTLGEFPIEHFIGPGRYIRLENKNYDLEKLKQAGIQAGDIVVFHSGMSSVYDDAEYFEDYPAMPDEVANYLAEQKVKIVGLDMCSPDHEVFSAHKILLAANVLIIENLTNLDKLADKEFTVYALPLNLQIDGAPARVIAEVKD